MLSVMCLEEMHLYEGCMHLMVYQWRPPQVAEVSSLQSQLHSVNGRSASGDRIFLPLSSREMFWNGTSSQQQPVSIEEELRAQSPGTPVGTIRDSIRPGAESFFKAMSLSNSVLSMVQQMSSGAF